MQSLRKMKRVLKQLKNPKTEYEKGVKQALLWATGQIPLVEVAANLNDEGVYKPKKLDYNKEEYRYVMEDPCNENKFYVVEKIYPNTPPSWWSKILIQDIPAFDQISLGDNFFQIPDEMNQLSHLAPAKIDWEDGWVLQKLYPKFFPNKRIVDQYLKNFELMYQEEKIEFTAEDRAAVRATGVSAKQVKSHIEEKCQCRFVYQYRTKGSDVWVFRKELEG